MTDRILKSIAYIFNPLIMPLLGVLFYFYKTPRYFPEEVMHAKIISIGILTVLLPIIIYFLLKTLGKVETVNLKKTRERLYPLALNAVIMVLVLVRVVSPSQIIELYFFFMGILLSNMLCLLLAFFKVKASIHMLSISGLFMFFIVLSRHFSINIIETIALISIILGAVATSRLHTKAHTYTELILGLIIGMLPQLVLGMYWV